MKTFHLILIMTIGGFSLWSCASKQVDKRPRFQHVVVIGFDGLSPDGLQNSSTPNFDRLIKEGSHTFHARAVLPTSSSSNWSSMIMGAGPEQHGITSNAWERNNLILPPVTQDEDFLFPTIFNLIDRQYPEAEIGAIYHWGGFGRLFEKKAVDYDINPKNEDETAKTAGKYILEKQPLFTFIHFDHVDHTGHEYGHGTEDYYQSVEKADTLLGEVMESISQAGILDKTLVIISSDHGGLGYGHGGETLDEIEIPFIVCGKGIKKGYEIISPVYQYDNAATVAYALGVELPGACIGKPVVTAFEGQNWNGRFPVTRRWQKPKILPGEAFNRRAGGLFNEKAKVEIQNPNEKGELRYTTDGSAPNYTSNLYSAPFEVDSNTIIKSAVFDGESMKSIVAEAYFRIKTKSISPAVAYSLFYLEGLSKIPDTKSLSPDAKGKCFEITSEEVQHEIKENTVVVFSTTLNVLKEDTYMFYTRSDDGSKLWIGDQLVVDNDGDHGVQEKSGYIKLDKGLHPLKVEWFNGSGGAWLDVYYQTRDIPKQIIPTSILTTRGNG